MPVVRRVPPSLMGLAVLVMACSPSLNWREARPEGAALSLLLPCKPERRTRQVLLAGTPVAVEVLACSADGTTWGLTSADLGAVERVGPALAALRAARSANLDGRETGSREVRVAGLSSAEPQALQLRVEGRKPDGQPVIEHALLFARDSRVFHAAALGGEPSAEALETFFGSIKPLR